jgi:hypothetical protein
VQDLTRPGAGSSRHFNSLILSSILDRGEEEEEEAKAEQPMDAHASYNKLKPLIERMRLDWVDKLQPCVICDRL